MKLPLVKSFSQLFLSPGAEFLNLQHAHLVGARLTGRDDVTFYFGFDFFFTHSCFLAHIGDRLVAGPALCMNTGINDQPYTAEKFVPEASQVSKRIVVVPPGLFCQPFAVKRPSFHVGGERNHFAKLWNTLELLGGGDLPMMSWYAFVIRKGRHTPFGHFVHVP